MNRKIITGMLLMVAILSNTYQASAQKGYSLSQLIDAAKKNNHLLAIKEYQVQEKINKLKEDEIKKYPSPTLEGDYQYNFVLPEITVPTGSLGAIPDGNGGSQPFPIQASKFSVGQKSSYNAGLNVYQPLSQQFKINTGLAIDKADIKLLQKEKEKTVLQVQLAIEQFYYNALITQKQAESETAKLELAKAKLYDAAGALTAGKTKEVNTEGLRADIAGQEQRLLKLDIQLQDYLGELGNLTNLAVTELEPEEVDEGSNLSESLGDYKSAAYLNPDMEIARLNKEKATLGIKAARQNNLPDLGVVTGYYVQDGNPVLPKGSPYIGISLKWNIQDLFTNKQIANQRILQLRQAEETIAYTTLQVESEIDKAWRKVKQSTALISAAKKLVSYRKEALKEELDRQVAGIDIKTALMETKAQLAEAEADLYSAQLSNTIAMAQLRNLSGRSR